MRVIAELQDIKHNRVRYDYSATARGKPGKRTRCRAFLKITEPGTLELLVELSIDGRVKAARSSRTYTASDPAFFRCVVRDAAENPEQWL